MGDTAVMYKSKYGHTRQYAEWIAEALDCTLLEYGSADLKRLGGFDTVIFGGGLYAGKISGAGCMRKLSCKNKVVFTVGLTNPGTYDYTPLILKNFPKESDTIRFFHFRGGIDYKKLNLPYRMMMAFLKKFIVDKTPEEELPQELRGIAEAYGGQVSFTDKQSIQPLIEYVRGLE